jgi:NitT/TauT family transport system substrate-binding protein
MLFLLMFAMIAPLSLVGMHGVAVRAQTSALSCEPLAPEAAAVQAETSQAPSEPAAELTPVTMGYVPALIFAPVFVAKEKGYFAEFGIDMTLEPLPGGSDMVVLTASGDFDAGIGGTGPAFFNAIDAGLPITVIAPGHQEGSPVATPLMISKEACESGEITSVADLKGKRVSVNARGATEYWLAAALATGGLTPADITVETLAFPDAVAALQSGAIDAAMVGEPLATQAERDGIAVRLASDFAVQNIQPTMIFANSTWAAENPELAAGIVAGFVKASRDLMAGGFSDPATLAIIEQYTNVPADLIAGAVKPVYTADGAIDLASISELQSFFRELDLLEYDDDIDPTTFVDTQFIEMALEWIGVADAAATPAP